MSDLQERFQRWADELVDLTARNELINFKVTKTSTILPEPKGLSKLLKGDTVAIKDLCDLTDPDQVKPAKGAIKTAIEFKEQRGIEVLKLASGFATWKTDKISNANAPLFLYSVELENEGGAFINTKLRLVDTEPEINPVLILHLQRRMAVGINDESFEELEELTEEKLWELFASQCPADLEIQKLDGHAIKNLKYPNLPMVADLQNATESLEENTLIAALAGDAESKDALREDISDARQDAPNFIPPKQEFLVLDADSSQQWAINTALQGQNLVIEGPPGTGKSQTIANLIACYIAAGKSVLFVAEKRAAIDAVKKRIDYVGLGDCFFDLHSSEAVRKRPTEPFFSALEEIKSVPDTDFSAQQLELEEVRQKLVDRSAAIQTKQEPWKCSYLEVLDLAMEAGNEPTRSFDLDVSCLDAINLEQIRGIEKCLSELISLAAKDLLARHSPIAKSIKNGQLQTTQAIRSALEALDKLKGAQRSIKGWLKEVEAKARSTGAEVLVQSPHQIQPILDNLDVIGESLGLIAPDLRKLPSVAQLKRLKVDLAQPFFLRCFKYLFDRSYRDSLAGLKSALQEDVQPTAETLRAACRSVSALSSLHAMGVPAGARTYPKDLRDTLTNFFEALSRLNSLMEDWSPDSCSIKEVDAVISRFEEIRTQLPFATDLHRELKNLEQLIAGSRELFDQMLDRLCAGESAKPICDGLKKEWSNHVEEAIRIQSPALRNSGRQYLDRNIETFRERDANHIRTNGTRIRRLCAERAHAIRNTHPEQADLIETQHKRRRKRKSARQLFAETPELLKALKPCWAMSPLVVSELLPPDKAFFDVVIFDEASQIVPFEAVTSILRGKQTIVAGDSKQLSPTSTSFFATKENEEEISTSDDPEDDAFDAVDEAESLLEAVKAVLPGQGVRTLSWHYRSEDERLIAFSNQHPELYGRRLVTAPSTSLEPPFEYHLVEGQLNDVTGKSPRAEIQRTVQVAKRHLTFCPDLSLAVIALGSEHARNIQNEFDRQLGEDPSIQLFPEGRPDEKFIIRHLESIQGDERDVVILSTGYGPREIGKLRYDFGPINRDKNLSGLRRLNVAVTRARKRVEVVSTINPYQYDDNKLNSIGAKGLIQYLRFVHSGGEDLGDLSADTVPMNPFEQDIYDSLRKQGIGMVPQYGVSGYRLDFAVQHPDSPGRFILAIEADGASYHSSETARDRDRIRQAHLEKLGWQFHRIWSTEWFRNKETEVFLATQAVQEAINAFEDNPKPAEPAPPPTPEYPAAAAPKKKGSEPMVPQLASIDDYGNELANYIIWFCSDGILRSDNEIFEALFEKLPFSRRGVRIVGRIEEEIKNLRTLKKIN
ncbi:MAG: AAA domain-containing protein [Synechococcus sp.]|uniref:AAA domain-containing protein n=1 Tax=Synechococcus sp. BMK-MC-1 TaxID=1442551 RepID=UPI00164739D4|nr:AAA domain-containing protein [Synechococcus sp. BMK-MC-1]QNI68718.1 type III restriction enzyme/ res subunit [Synechococcus sp. BMK-MC-1]